METSEFDVEQVLISKPTPMSQASVEASTTDSIRYPRAGKPNAKSTVKIVEFEIGETKDAQPINIKYRQLWGKDEIRVLFPWVEYIVRFGWLPDGQR